MHTETYEMRTYWPKGQSKHLHLFQPHVFRLWENTQNVDRSTWVGSSGPFRLDRYARKRTRTQAKKGKPEHTRERGRPSRPNKNISPALSKRLPRPCGQNERERKGERDKAFVSGFCRLMLPQMSTSRPLGHMAAIRGLFSPFVNATCRGRASLAASPQGYASLFKERGE